MFLICFVCDCLFLILFCLISLPSLPRCVKCTSTAIYLQQDKISVLVLLFTSEKKKKKQQLRKKLCADVGSGKDTSLRSALDLVEDSGESSHDALRSPARGAAHGCTTNEKDDWRRGKLVRDEGGCHITTTHERTIEEKPRTVLEFSRVV